MTSDSIDNLQIPILTPEEQEKLDSLDDATRKVILISRTFMRYCENNLMIKTKKGELTKLVPNRVQRRLLERVIKKLIDGEPIRFIILKARQQGVSTIVEALIYWWTATHKYVQSKIIAHDTSTSEHLYNMFRTYYENSNPIFQPTTRYVTRSDLTFDNQAEPEKGLHSQIDTATAENAGTGRGQTVQWLHGSEVAKWRNGQELVAGLMQGVPLLAYTAVFLESTANGIGDYFHTTWEAAKRGESVFEPLFFPWSIHEEYNLPVPKNFHLTQDEKKLKKEFKLEDSQIVWRRMKMREFVGDEKRFYQEYPLTDSEAFLASGTPRFNINQLIKMEEKCYAPQTVELLETKDRLGTIKITPKTVENAPLKVWFQPQEAHEYVIGADVAEGVGEDFSVATVMDKANHTAVARWRGDCEPSEFGEIIEQLARWYNRALVGVEVNNHGLTTIQRIRDLNYDNIYRRERGIDERYEEYTSKLGWQTSTKTKPLMINDLSEAISKEEYIDYDRITIRELMTYVIDTRGRTNAQEGQNDDCVISTAICFQLFEWNPINELKLRVHSKFPSRYVEQKKKNKQLKKGKLFKA